MKTTRYTGSMPSSRTYFFDATTGEELMSGAALGRHEAAILDGERYMDTSLGFIIVRAGMRCDVTADDFPGRRVLVKTWHPGMRDGRPGVEWACLVSTSRGWQGNEADTDTTQQIPGLGVEDYIREMYAARRVAS